MGESDLKRNLTAHTGDFMAAVLLLQPLLDVLSFFMIRAGATAVTTALRMGMLAAVSAYGFVLTDRRRLYLTMYAVIGGFWLLHALNCLRTGYTDPVGDLAEYLKLAQFPLWTFAFMTFFAKGEGLDQRAIGLVAVNFVVILLVVGISFAVGDPVYTYAYPERGAFIGALGWFGEANSQSVVLCLIVPVLLLWGLKSDHSWIFALCCLGGFSLLYLTGTRLTYYTALLLAAAFLVLAFLERKRLMFFVPCGVALVLLLVFRGASPMAERQAMTGTSFAVYQEKIDRVMGEDKDYQYDGGEIPPETLEKIRRVYTEIYGGKGVYNEELLGGLIRVYGVDEVMETFDYSLRPEVLNNSRDRKLRAAKMVWQEKGFLTHLLGFEYASVVVDGINYDPENDFPSLVYYTGYLGAALYVGFLLWIFLTAGAAFFRRFPELLTAEYAVAAMLCVLTVGAAMLTGHTLRRPNVLVYSALAAALLLYRARRAPSRTRLRGGYGRDAVVRMKRIP